MKLKSLKCFDNFEMKSLDIYQIHESMNRIKVWNGYANKVLIILFGSDTVSLVDTYFQICGITRLKVSSAKMLSR